MEINSFNLIILCRHDMESRRNIEENQLRVCKILRTTKKMQLLLVETTAKQKKKNKKKKKNNNKTITVFAGVR